MDTFSLAIIDSVRRSTIVAPHALISDVFFRDAIFLARHLRDRLPSTNSAPSFLAPHSTLHHPFSFANPSFNWLVIRSLNRFRVDWIDFALIIHIILLHYYFQFQFWFSCSNRARLCTPIIYVLFLFLFRNAINRQASLVLLQFWSFLSLWTSIRVFIQFFCFVADLIQPCTSCLYWIHPGFSSPLRFLVTGKRSRVTIFHREPRYQLLNIPFSL